MINIQQITIEVQMLVPANLDGGVTGLFCHGARREGHLGIEAEGREGDLGQAFGGKLSLVDDNLLDIRVRRTGPMRNEWCHFCCELVTARESKGSRRDLQRKGVCESRW